MGKSKIILRTKAVIVLLSAWLLFVVAYLGDLAIELKPVIKDVTSETWANFREMYQFAWRALLTGERS